MLRKFLISMLLSSIFLGGTYGQEETSLKKLEREAKKAYKQEDYAYALPLLIQLHKQDSLNIDLHYQIGVCYFNLNQKQQSIPWFEYVAKNKPDKEYTNIEYYLGKVYHAAHEFAEAIRHYEVFLDKISADNRYEKDFKKEIIRNINNCQTGMQLSQKPLKCIIRNAGDQINTKGDESAPVITKDGKYLYFTTVNAAKHTTGQGLAGPQGDIHSVKDVNGNFSMPFTLSFHLNSEHHDVPLFITEDNSTIYFLSVTPGRANDIYYSEFKNNDWTAPVPLGEPFNSTANETGFCLSKDGNTAYFSSDRPGGYGGQDIYVVYKKDGKWGEPINLGPKVNGPDYEEAPVLSADGRTLYFASDGPNSIGGYDLFKATIKNNTVTNVYNLGMPINSAEDEKHISFYAHGMKGYFSSKRDMATDGEEIYFLQIIDTTISPAMYLTRFEPEELFEEEILKPDTGQVLKDVIYFDFNASRVADFSGKRLNKVLLLMNNYPDLKLEVQGYTDQKGSVDANYLVSERRAKSVYSYLVSKGLSPDRLKPVGYGSEHLVSDSEDELEQAKNRRVEFKVLPADYSIQSNVNIGKYFIVKASYNKLIYAELEQNNLKKQGIATTILKAEDKEIYRLILGETTSYEEAKKLTEEARKKYGPSIWILSY